jgi:hypothetical protein
MSKQRKPSPEPRNAEQSPKQPADRAAAGCTKFSDEPAVQKPLFQLDQGGAR